jgi:hypothetical protein
MTPKCVPCSCRRPEQAGRRITLKEPAVESGETTNCSSHLMECWNIDKNAPKNPKINMTTSTRFTLRHMARLEAESRRFVDFFTLKNQ